MSLGRRKKQLSMLCDAVRELREAADGRIVVKRVASDYAGRNQIISLEHGCKDVCRTDDGRPGVPGQVRSGPAWG